MRLIKYKIENEIDVGATVFHILHSNMHIARSHISKMKLNTGYILLNGNPVYTNVAVQLNDIITANVDDINPVNYSSIKSCDLDIKYMDDDIIIINKPAGMAIHGSDKFATCTVANSYAYMFGNKTAFHPVHRLDKGTSGLLVIAKSGYVQDRVRRMMHTENFTREYLAVINGKLTNPSGYIDLPITKQPINGIKRAIDKTGSKAISKYNTVLITDKYSMVNVFPITGRTHQIRIHFSSIGFPLVGDTLYGSSDSKILRPALHSYRIRLLNPITNKFIEIHEEIPRDMNNLLTHS